MSEWDSDPAALMAAVEMLGWTDDQPQEEDEEFWKALGGAGDGDEYRSSGLDGP